MKRVAVIFEGNIYRRLGVFNAVINRIKHIQAIQPPYEIDVFMIQGYDRGINRLLHHKPKVTDRQQSIVANGITINIKWFAHSLLDSVAHKVLGKRAPIYMRWLGKLARELAHYDLISAHDRIAGTAAAIAHEQSGTPFYITWHGASIYTDPIHDKVYKRATIELLHKPFCNFFVSKGLETEARKLTSGFNASVLYNGASKEFARQDESSRQSLRAIHNISEGTKVVAFVGRFDHIKNAQMLPDIFYAIAQKYQGKIEFWGIGDGPMQKAVHQKIKDMGLSCRMFGKVMPKEMPALYNCIDVVVLPSKVEAISLVAIEAIQSGANVVASHVVGTSEAVGAENTVPFDSKFIENMSNRVAKMLSQKIDQQLPKELSWANTARIENDIYCKTLNLR